MKKLFLLTIVAAFGTMKVAAQTNLQVFYDFGSDRRHVTTTLEGFYNDNWGNTFFFVDYDFNEKDSNHQAYAPSGSYMEIARCLNFWNKTKFAPLSFQVEYNGGVYKGFNINNSWLFGVDYFMHSKDFKNTLNLKALYKTIARTDQNVPMQLTAVWGCQDIFGVKGLRFSGFADFWWEDHYVHSDFSELKHTVFLTEPQLWYNIGQHIGVDNLNIGGEVEISNNFGSFNGFTCNPCLGAKWVF